MRPDMEPIATIESIHCRVVPLKTLSDNELPDIVDHDMPIEDLDLTRCLRCLAQRARRFVLTNPLQRLVTLNRLFSHMVRFASVFAGVHDFALCASE